MSFNLYLLLYPCCVWPLFLSISNFHSFLPHSQPAPPSHFLLFHSLLTSLGNLLPAVIPVLLGDSQPRCCQPLFGWELSDIPELDGLVLRVADQITCVSLAQRQSEMQGGAEMKKEKKTKSNKLNQITKDTMCLANIGCNFAFWELFYWQTGKIAVALLSLTPHLAVDEGDAVSVAGQLSDRLRPVLPQRPSVPHLAQRVVAAREEQLGRAVSKCHCIHIILVGINLTGTDGKERQSVSLWSVCGRLIFFV